MAPSSEERERAARAGFEAFNTGDQNAVTDLLAQDVVVFANPELPNAGRFEGRDGYIRWVEPWIDAWQDLGMEIEELTVVGDRHVLAEVHQTGHGRAGIEVSMNVAFLFEIRDGGEVAYLALHPDRGSALADAEARESA
jgi:ketosteroid isomerase-like protein